MLITMRRSLRWLRVKLWYRSPGFRRDLNAILKTIDLHQFEALCARHQFTDLETAKRQHVCGQKYLDLHTYLPVNLARAYSLGLHRSPPKRILDIGTGTGYFPYVCQYLGHTVVAIDKDDKPIYNEVTRLLGIDRRSWEVNAFTDLPDLGFTFDLVTAFRVVFNRNSIRGQVWRVPEWNYFLADLADHLLLPRGRIFLDLNAEPDGQWYDTALREYFVGHGATVDDSIVDFRSGVKRCSVNKTRAENPAVTHERPT